MVLVDTNVLLDLATNDPIWADWSLGQLEAASLVGPVLINDIIYAELAVRYERIEDLDAFIDLAELTQAPIRALRSSSPARHSPAIATPAVRAPAFCRISSSARRPQSRTCRS